MSSLASTLTYDSWDKSSTKLEWHGILPKNMERWNREEMIDLEGVTQDMIDSLEAVNWQDPNMADQFVHDEEVRMDAAETNRGSRAALAYKKDRSDGTISCLYVRVNVTFKLSDPTQSQIPDASYLKSMAHTVFMLPGKLYDSVVSVGSSIASGISRTREILVCEAPACHRQRHGDEAEIIDMDELDVQSDACDTYITSAPTVYQLPRQHQAADPQELRQNFDRQNGNTSAVNKDDENEDPHPQDHEDPRKSDREDPHTEDETINEDVLKLIEEVFRENGFQT